MTFSKSEWRKVHCLLIHYLSGLVFLYFYGLCFKIGAFINLLK
ncbi:putative membrane protein [Escherichia coli 2-011-08_S1_C1]|nr:putative membrane protein [Escherichia coli 2-011-08_S1_C1]